MRRRSGFFERSLRLEPANSQAENNRATVLSALGRPAEALACLDRALALKPDDPGLHYNRGNTLMTLLRDDEALAAFDAALSRQGDFRQALQNKGIVLTRLGRPVEALATYERLLALYPRRCRGRRYAFRGTGKSCVGARSDEPALGSAGGVRRGARRRWRACAGAFQCGNRSVLPWGTMSGAGGNSNGAGAILVSRCMRAILRNHCGWGRSRWRGTRSCFMLRQGFW